MVKKKFYITTAIDYVNAEPHIGHAYQKIAADILARWNRLQGKEVFFLTGTDEHGQKIAKSAENSGLKPKQFVDKMSEKFRESWDLFNISYDKFIRTTESRHEKFVQNFIKKIEKDIYKGTYEGCYCVGCEAYKTDKELINDECPYHPGKKVEKIKEETYFFKLSKYQNKLLKLYKTNPDYILPRKRASEIINRVKDGLKDLSITRTNFDWGIPFPLDKKHVVYVWFDALLNYLSGLDNKKFWPADVQLLGVDNSWFHCVIWPAMLLSAGEELSRSIFVHGFLTFNGQKISKSLGNGISPKILVEKYSADSVRYFISRNFVFGQDGDFSEEALVERHNNELANKLGNLISRVSALAEKYGLEKCENKLIKKLRIKEIEKHFENYEIDRALGLIFDFIDNCNEFVQENKIWETGNKKVIYEIIDSIKAIAILLWAFMPESCEKIAKIFNFKIDYVEIKKPIQISKIKKADILFKKLEKENINKAEKVEGVMNSNSLSYEHWQKLDLRVGKILKVEEIEGADKLYKLEVDIGTEKKIVCAGLKKFYKKDELKGKRCIIFVNLEPRVMKGVRSEGMILAAVNDDESKVVLIQPEKDIDIGARVR